MVDWWKSKTFALFKTVVESDASPKPSPVGEGAEPARRMRCSYALSNPSVTASRATSLCTKEANLCHSFCDWLVKKQGLLLCLRLLSKATHFPSLLLEVAKRHEGLRKQLSIVFPRVWPSRSETGGTTKEWRMRCSRRRSTVEFVRMLMARPKCEAILRDTIFKKYYSLIYLFSLYKKSVPFYL